ncbi:MAG: hypothetical protein GF401_09735 [Chitinivibrionales bacterium]|nr:hypothetical protein [Chitinivibrionales bacterium]
MKKVVLWLLSMVVVLSAESMDILFLGIFEGGAPSFEKSYEQMLRENLATFDGTNLIDRAQTEKFKSMLDFRGTPVLSKTLALSLQRHYMDTILVVWGEIRNYTVTPYRRNLIGSGIIGKVTASLTMYSLRDRDMAFAGDIECEIAIGKDLFYFGSMKKLHISAAEQSKIIETLSVEAANKSAQMVKAVARAKIEQTRLEFTGVEEYKEPSISDVFNIPSVEGSEVGFGEEDTEQSEPSVPEAPSEVSSEEPQDQNAPE